MEKEFYLREVTQDDLPIFFEQQNDPDAIHMAAFTAKNPSDLETFNIHLSSIRVLEKCGFQITDKMKGFANARDEEIEELVLMKTAVL